MLDPVLLLRREEYIALPPETKIFKSTTVFCYLLHLKREDYILITMLENLAEKLNALLKIVGGQEGEELISSKYYMNLSTKDFL